MLSNAPFVFYKLPGAFRSISAAGGLAALVLSLVLPSTAAAQVNVSQLPGRPLWHFLSMSPSSGGSSVAQTGWNDPTGDSSWSNKRNDGWGSRATPQVAESAVDAPNRGQTGRSGVRQAAYQEGVRLPPGEMAGTPQEEVVYWDDYAGSDSIPEENSYAQPGSCSSCEGNGYSGGCGFGDCGSPGPGYGPGCYGRMPFFLLPRMGGRLWVRTEYISGWSKGFDVPALVTTSSDAPPALPTSGAIGEANTTVLFGNELLNSDARSAGRISFGFWLDPCKMAAIEASYTGFSDQTTNFMADGNTNTVITRPYYSVGVLPNADWAWPIEFPPLFSGSIAVNATTDFHGTEVLLRRALYSQCNRRLDFVIGYRTARLNDDLQISHSVTALTADLFPAGTVWNAADRFSTKNEFHGAELGVIAEMRRQRWSLEMLMKLSFGGTNSTVDINGNTTLNGVAAGDGGVLTRPSNIGTYSSDEFTMIPELGATLGYDLSCNLRFMFGYTFMYWSKVARPGDQIDLALELVNGSLPPLQVVGSRNPEFPFATTDFWAQGLSLGLDYRF